MIYTLLKIYCQKREFLFMVVSPSPDNPKYKNNPHSIWEKFQNELNVLLISNDDCRIIILR